MAQEQITPPKPALDPNAPPPPVPVDPELARSTAHYTFVGANGSMKGAFDGVKNARLASDSWSDEFWAASGYDKETTRAALDSLIAAGDTFSTEQADNIAVLGAQSD